MWKSEHIIMKNHNWVKHEWNDIILSVSKRVCVYFFYWYKILDLMMSFQIQVIPLGRQKHLHFLTNFDFIIIFYVLGWGLLIPTGSLLRCLKLIKDQLFSSILSYTFSSRFLIIIRLWSHSNKFGVLVQVIIMLNFHYP
jgi:hypothetical protein